MQEYEGETPKSSPFLTPDGRSVERFVVGYSGGKDSLATALLCRDLGPTTLLHADTGWEHPGHADYLHRSAEALGLPLVIVRSEIGGMADVIRHKRMFPSRTRRFCTTELKIKPIAAYLSAQEDEVVSAIGVRAQESAARATLPEWSMFEEADVWTWRPILSWPLDRVLDKIRASGMDLHPHYHDGAARVGCYPCIYARKAEIATLPDWRVEEIAALEREIEAGAKDGGKRAFLHCKDPLNASGTGFVPINRVVEWARTSRGGRELLLPLPVEAPCVAWGLCERPDDSHPARPSTNPAPPAVEIRDRGLTNHFDIVRAFVMPAKPSVLQSSESHYHWLSHERLARFEALQRRAALRQVEARLVDLGQQERRAALRLVLLESVDDGALGVLRYRLAAEMLDGGRHV